MANRKKRNAKSAKAPASSTARVRRRRAWRLRTVLFGSVAIVIGLFVGLILAEIGLRVFSVEPMRLFTKRSLARLDGPDPHDYHCFPTNPHQDFVRVPDTSDGRWRLRTYSLPPTELPLDRLQETPWCVEYKRNSMRFRDRELSRKPAAGVRRVAVVGDSFTFGEGVPIDATLPSQLGAVLGSQCEVVNCGQVGASTADELTMAYDAIAKLGCRRMLLVFLVNDIALTPELNERQEFIDDLIIFRDEHLERRQQGTWYKGNLRLLDLVGSKWEMYRVHHETLRWYRDSYDPAYNRQNLQVLATQLSEMAVLPDCQVAVVIYPLLVELETDYPLAEVHRRVAEMARASGLPVVDLQPAFAGRTASELWAHPADHHPNRQAHRVAADAIANWLHTDLPEFLLSVDDSPQPADALANSPSTKVEATATPSFAQEVAQAETLAASGDLWNAKMIFLKILELQPRHVVARAWLGNIAFQQGRLTAAMVHYQSALERRPGWIQSEIILAAILAVHPDPRLRDPRQAVRLAKHACAATNYQRIEFLDVLVLAYGEAGDYDLAIKTAVSAIDRAHEGGTSSQIQRLTAKLEDYRAKQQAATTNATP